VVAPDGVEVPPGERGEIVIRGAGVVAGYEAEPAVNEAAFVDGWLRTGDQGRFDEDGYLYVTGRLKELINRGGEKVSPKEIDEALLEHPQVLEAAAFGVPHPSLGEDVAAAVVVRDRAAVDAPALRAHLLKRLAKRYLPEAIIKRPKKGFGAPLGTWLRGPLRDLAGDLFSPDRIRSAGLFEPAEVSRLLADHLAGRADNRKPLFTLMVFELWRDRWLRRAPRSTEPPPVEAPVRRT